MPHWLDVPPECSGERLQAEACCRKSSLAATRQISSFLNVVTSIFWALSPTQVLQLINWQLGSNISLCRFYLLMMSLEGSFGVHTAETHLLWFSQSPRKGKLHSQFPRGSHTIQMMTRHRALRFFIFGFLSVETLMPACGHLRGLRCR